MFQVLHLQTLPFQVLLLHAQQTIYQQNLLTDEFFYSLITKNVVDQKCLTQAGAYAAGYLFKKKKITR
jgi:hypothetical protein